jgi:hypothetical protein
MSAVGRVKVLVGEVAFDHVVRFSGHDAVEVVARVEAQLGLATTPFVFHAYFCQILTKG